MINLGGIVGNGGGPHETFKGAVPTYDADIHQLVINELFHRHTGINTTVAVAVSKGDTSIQVVDGSSFTNGNPLEISNGAVESTFPVVISGGGTNNLVLDRPLDNDFAITNPVQEISTNMNVSGSLAVPISFKMVSGNTQVWKINRFLIGLVHSLAADDSKFGSIGALINGCVLRGYDAVNDQFRTFTNWKSNIDVKMDMYDLIYTDKAGGGKFGTNGRGSLRVGSGAIPRLDGNAGDYLELLIQDDLTALTTFNVKGQGYVEGQ